MTDTFGDGDLDLLEVLPRLTRLSTVLQRSRLIERATESAGITVDRPGMSVLVILYTSGQPLRVGEVARRMQVVGPHVTRQVHELERRGLARRIADPHDQRARLIELTPGGAEAAERYVRTLLGWFADALAEWSADDRRTFGRLLERFATDLTTRLAALDDD
ncbi:MarR family winged helix-turn-helix transcriptional regulator [Herbidospora cretacea]|uniref:MarR family winged helix-turn-helix transcriptional regulator n=1 Tax=Herbidospora cretacea TaxID=28444 RepID=UPI0007732D24|nr:MarR family transcriptional regulator [Herbidospora cretacea]